MIYEIFVLIYVFLGVIGYIFYKTIKIDAIHTGIISIIFLVIPITIYIYIDYKINPKKYRVKKNKLKYGDNPFKNIFNKYTFFLGILGTLTYIPFLFCLKLLPINFIIPVGMFWIISSLYFNKIIRKVPITQKKIMSIVLVIIGVLVMQYQKLVKEFSFNYSYIFPILILLFTQVTKGIFITYTKEISEIVSSEQLIMIGSISSLFLYTIVYIIYTINPFKKWDVIYPLKIDIIKLSLFAFFVNTLSNYLKYTGMKKLTVNRYNLLVSTKVIFSIILAKFLVNEKITLYHIVGCVILLIGLNIVTIDSFIHKNTIFPHPLN